MLFFARSSGALGQEAIWGWSGGYVENAMSFLVFFAMIIYGFGKIIQFDGPVDVNKTIPELTGMELMWAFYGYSKVFALIIGALEVIGGILIFFKTTRLIGCFFTSTILINIIIQDIVFKVNYGALMAALFYQALIIIILYLNRSKVLGGFRYLLVLKTSSANRKKWLVKIGLSIVFFVIFRTFEYFITTKF